jgi:MFS superfamily sulfate permease-like transporter
VAGAKSKMSAIFHGIMLLISVLFLTSVMNKIPLSSLAVLLLFVGYKLTKPELYKELYKNGLDQFLPFIITVLAIVFTDLLKGVAIGLLVSVYFIIKNTYKRSVSMTSDADNYLIRLKGNVSFLNKAVLRNHFEKMPNGAFVIIDGASALFIDKDIIEIIEEFILMAPCKNITVDKKISTSSPNPYFKKLN